MWSEATVSEPIRSAPNKLSLYYDLSFCQRLIQAISHSVCDFRKRYSFKILFTTSCSVPYIKLKMKHLIKNLEGEKNSDILIVRITFFLYPFGCQESQRRIWVSIIATLSSRVLIWRECLRVVKVPTYNHIEWLKSLFPAARGVTLGMFINHLSWVSHQHGESDTW